MVEAPGISYLAGYGTLWNGTEPWMCPKALFSVLAPFTYVFKTKPSTLKNVDEETKFRKNILHVGHFYCTSVLHTY
jgi:hypothetical protein